MLSDRFIITNAQWALMEPHCFGKKSDPGRTGGDSRLFMEAVLWIARTGAPWRDLPPEFGNWLRENLANSGIEPVIPPKSNRKFPPEFDSHSYKWRHLIENYFQKLKEFKRIALRACKTDQSFSSMIYLAATIINSR